MKLKSKSKTPAKKTAKSPYKFKKGDKVSIVIRHDKINRSEILTILSSDDFMSTCETHEGSVYMLSNSYLKLIPKPRTVLTIITPHGKVKIVKTEAGFHNVITGGNSEPLMTSEVLESKQAAIDNVIAVVKVAGSREMKEAVRKLMSKGGRK